MAKGAVGLVAGYWPENVYRHLAVPGLSVDEGALARPARRWPDRVAVVAGEEALSYQQLAASIDQLTAALRQALGPTGQRVAVVAEGDLDLLRLLLAGLRARCITLLAAPGSEGELTRQLAAFHPDLVVADSPDSIARLKVGPALPPLAIQELQRGEPSRPGSSARLDLKAPAVALPWQGRVVYHSHASLLAWAVSWSAFIPLTGERVVMNLEPLAHWLTLSSALGVLLRGGTCVLAAHQLHGQERGFAGLDARPIHLTLATARLPLLAGHKSALRDRVEALFVSVAGPFSIQERWRLEATLGLPVLTVLGSAAAGPVLASHPEWYLQEAVGIPVTNVDVWPLHPRTHAPFAVPWEAIEYGELGVRSPMTATQLGAPEDRMEWIRDGWLRLGVVAAMDPTGLFHLRS